MKLAALIVALHLDVIVTSVVKDEELITIETGECTISIKRKINLYYRPPNYTPKTDTNFVYKNLPFGDYGKLTTNFPICR